MIRRIQALICALLLFGVAPVAQAQDVSSLTARAAAILEGASANSNEVQTLLAALTQAREPEADCMAALLLRDIRRDTAQALSLLLRAAQNGSPRAQWELGNMLLEGKGTAQNSRQAAEWYRRAAVQGFAPAQYNLGICCERGLGLRASLPEAAVWYERAADQDYPEAQYSLGNLLMRGDGVVKNPARAATLFRASAEQGYVPAISNLGQCRLDGHGVAQDPAEAARLFRVAADNLFCEPLNRRAHENHHSFCSL